MSRLSTLRSMGAFLGTLYIASRVLTLMSFGHIKLIAYHLVAQPITHGVATATRNRGIEVREVGPDEVFALPVERPLRVLKARFGQGARCLMASQRSRFLGFLWFVQGAYEEDEVRCLFVPLPSEITVWDFDVYVEPSARLGFTFHRLWDEANKLLSSVGVKWSLSRISAFNAGSLASHRRLGSVRIATAAFLCAGSAQMLFASTRPYFHLALRRTSRPVIRLHAP